MNDTDIRKYADLMRELDLTGLEITENDRVVRLERAPAVSPLPRETVAVAAAPAEAAPAPAAGEAEGDVVTSPMVGVFYAAPAENAEPFVKVGDHVKRGQTLCIVEAMKLMNEITAEQMGTIREVCVKDADPVEFGTVLFYLEPHDPENN